MSKSNSRRIAFYGVLSALMFVFLLIETYLFTAFFGSFTPAILTLPLAVALSTFLGKKSMFVGGLIFGSCSFVLAIIIANPIFINPLISILPRIFIGVVAYGVYALFGIIFKNKQESQGWQIARASISGAFGILTNSVCTIFMMWIFNQAQIAMVLTTIISINFVAEIIGAMVLVPIYQKALLKIRNKF